MRAHKLTAKELIDQGSEGWIVAQDVRSTQGKRIIKKGAILDRDAFESLIQADGALVHVVEPDPEDVHEDEAGRRLAEAVAGEGVRVKGPALSRYNLVADRKGVLRIDPELIFAVNRIPGLSVFTHLDRQAVLPGKIVTGVKITPLTVPERDIARAERLLRQAPNSAVRVVPFEHKHVAVIATEGLSEKLRDRFTDSIEQKIGWYGSDITSIRFVASDAGSVTQAMRDVLQTADIILVAGGNTLDPLDPAFLALEAVGGQMIHYGAPSHPGSMFWLAEVGDVPIFNLASCSMYSSVTFADLILPLAMTGERLTEEEIDRFGYGGLLDREMRFRFPPYEFDVSDEENEGD
jgi:hypothetical protein